MTEDVVNRIVALYVVHQLAGEQLADAAGDLVDTWRQNLGVPEIEEKPRIASIRPKRVAPVRASRSLAAADFQ